MQTIGLRQGTNVRLAFNILTHSKAAVPNCRFNTLLLATVLCTPCAHFAEHVLSTGHEWRGVSTIRPGIVSRARAVRHNDVIGDAVCFARKRTACVKDSSPSCLQNKTHLEALRHHVWLPRVLLLFEVHKYIKLRLIKWDSRIVNSYHHNLLN